MLFLPDSMGRLGTLRISYTLFLLAMLEVMVWSLPLVHSALGGSAADIRGYLSRETENTNHIDNTLIARQHEQLEMKRDMVLEASIGEQDLKLLARHEKEQMALLSDYMTNGYIVRLITSPCSPIIHFIAL